MTPRLFWSRSCMPRHLWLAKVLQLNRYCSLQPPKPRPRRRRWSSELFSTAINSSLFPRFQTVMQAQHRWRHPASWPPIMISQPRAALVFQHHLQSLSKIQLHLFLVFNSSSTTNCWRWASIKSWSSSTVIMIRLTAKYWDMVSQSTACLPTYMSNMQWRSKKMVNNKMKIGNRETKTSTSTFRSSPNIWSARLTNN